MLFISSRSYLPPLEPGSSPTAHKKLPGPVHTKLLPSHTVLHSLDLFPPTLPLPISSLPEVSLGKIFIHQNPYYLIDLRHSTTDERTLINELYNLYLSTSSVLRSWEPCGPRCTVTFIGRARASWGHRQGDTESYLKHGGG